MSLVRRLGVTLLRFPTMNRAARAFACFRGHCLVLVYHRLGASAAAGCEIVPSVPVNVFRAQLQALGEVVDLVSLDDLLAPDRSGPDHRRRPAVAVTFDDDLRSHAEHAVPILCEFGVPGAFFLSGRALHGLGTYWFQHLEALLVANGARRTAELMDAPASDAAGLMSMCERSAHLRGRVGKLAVGLDTADVLQRDAIAALGAAGMTVGFHTVAHDPLPDLDDVTLEDAVSRGRDDLATVARTPVRYFAYPHGKTDIRVAAAVRRAGFAAAFTGRPQPVTRRDGRHGLGRWEPGPLGVDDLLVALAVRLHRAAQPRST